MYKAVQDHHSWVVRCSQKGRKCLDNSHPGDPPDSGAFEITGRFMMRLVTSFFPGRSPLNSTGATLLRAFSVVHADGQSTSRSTWASHSQSQSEVEPSQKPNLRDSALMTNLSPRVIWEDSPHCPSVLGAILHHSGDAVLHVGLCRQKADATVKVLRETLRFHGLVVLCSNRDESTHGAALLRAFRAFNVVHAGSQLEARLSCASRNQSKSGVHPSQTAELREIAHMASLSPQMYEGGSHQQAHANSNGLRRPRAAAATAQVH